MEKEKMDLWDAACDMDNFQALLSEDADALEVLYDKMEAEGYQTEEHFEEWQAINFVHRFPMYLSAMRVIRRDAEQNVAALRAASDKACEAHTEQKEATA